MKNISERVPVYRVRLDGAAGGDGRTTSRSSSRPIGDHARSDQARRSRTLRRRALQAGFLVAFLAVINLLTSPSYLWFLWPAFFITAFLAWDALKLYYPGLADADDHEWQKIGGDATFFRNTRFRGRIDGNVVVARGVHLELTGSIGGNLTIERNAVAEVQGKIGGHVLNRGGTLRLSGELDGELREEARAAPPTAAKREPEHSHRP